MAFHWAFAKQQGKKYYFVWQEDGNMCVYLNDDSYIWGLADIRPLVNYSFIKKMVFKNGNLFAYDEYGKKLWQTGAKANQFNVLKMLILDDQKDIS